jgi:hypothetical protein
MKVTWGFFLFLLLTFQNIFADKGYAGNRIITDSSITMNFSYIRDTLFTSQPFYIEINLTTQTGYLHSRDGNVKIFGISSGTDKLEEGINTKEGLFVIKSKMPKWYSRQFDSTLMLNWMGFNYGIGFHALKSSGYYKYLGKKKSSHGCVRVSRTMAKFLYDTIKIGTPVLVHKGNSIITITFTDSTREFVHYNLAELKKEIALRYKQMYTGRYFINSRESIIIDNNNIGHQGLPIGNPKNILKRQIIKSPSSFVQSVIPPNKGIMIIHKSFPREVFNIQIISK